MFRSFIGFEKQFTPVDGGYLYFPSLKTGGKLVTAQEYQDLVQQWERVTGLAAILKVLAIGLPTLIVSAFLVNGLELPDWALLIPVFTLVGGMVAWRLPASLAPVRLVKDRPAITSPRPISEAWRQTRAMISWPSTVFFLLMSAAFFFRSAQSPDDTLTSSAALVFWALMLAAHIWIAIQKLRD